MENMALAVKKTMSQFLKETGSCPKCGGKLYQWRSPKAGGNEKCGPTCIDCGYHEMVQKNKQQERKLYLDAIKNAAIGKMKKNSMVTDDQIWECTFENFKVVDSETGTAKSKAQAWSREIADGANLHAIMTGKPGAGKTHLGMAIIRQVMEMSGYQISCSVVSYRELLEQLRYAMGDAEARKAVTGSLMSEIKKSDFVVIDDLGAELGQLEELSKPSTYDLDTLTSLAEARMNKATIFTSNLNSKELLTAYGERIYSRLLNGAVEEDGINALRFKETADKRRHPI